MNDLFWFFSGLSLIIFGQLHEIFLYWLQLKKQWYSRKFGHHGFFVHAFQLGGVWIFIGLGLLGVFWKMPAASFHQTPFLKVLGILIIILGVGLMGGSAWQLGWKRVMKIRIFFTPEPSWIRTGLFRFLQNPMYVGSQVAMFGWSLALDSWFLLIYILPMAILQKILATLENHPSVKYL